MPTSPRLIKSHCQLSFAFWDTRQSRGHLRRFPDRHQDLLRPFKYVAFGSMRGSASLPAEKRAALLPEISPIDVLVAGTDSKGGTRLQMRRPLAHRCRMRPCLH